MTPARQFLKDIKAQAMYLDCAALAIDALRLEAAIRYKDNDAIYHATTDLIECLYKQIAKRIENQRSEKDASFYRRVRAADALEMSRIATRGAELAMSMLTPKNKAAKRPSLKVAA